VQRLDLDYTWQGHPAVVLIAVSNLNAK
jgi:hypothetical protein